MIQGYGSNFAQKLKFFLKITAWTYNGNKGYREEKLDGVTHNPFPESGSRKHFFKLSRYFRSPSPFEYQNRYFLK